MGTVRIIGGCWRGARLHFPDRPGLRPTPDRVRETLFNWLGQRLDGLRCLDLFAGSGVLSFEAVSRGALHATLVERDRRLVLSLHRFAATHTPDRFTILFQDALQCAARWENPVDCLFLDPPYRSDYLMRLTPYVDRLVRPEGVIYAEAAWPIATLGGWQTVRYGQAGQVHFHLLRRAP
ncbi:MAG: 16S rRNA (guanine(966)-N(2))-methyltransferase RsmD [Hydrogenophilus sp.]|nr:16S rRNA (guanine(966)-N(2))-methyltransferase RsmD [Hydrogenophilus sp.]